MQLKVLNQLVPHARHSFSKKVLRRKLREGKFSKAEADAIKKKYDVSVTEFPLSRSSYHDLRLRMIVTLKSRNREPDPKSPSGVDNVAYLYHGTSMECAWKAMFRGFSPGSDGLFGPGMYFGDEIKANAYSRYDYYRARAMMKVRVNLGKIMESTRPGNFSTLESRSGADSVAGRAGITTSWSGYLRNDEWCVYDKSQIVVDAVTFYLCGSSSEELAQEFMTVAKLLS